MVSGYWKRKGRWKEQIAAIEGFSVKVLGW